jgi:hypothetical protein
MKQSLNTAALVLLLLIPAYSQSSSSGAHELLIPVGAKSMGMNNSYISGVSGIDAIYVNPAGLANNTGTIDAMFTYMSYIADINLSYAAAAANLGEFGTFALSLKTIDVGDIPVTTTQQPYGTGELFSPTLLISGISYSRAVSPNISIGINTNIIFEKIFETSATGVSFDLGFQYHNLAVPGLNIGAALKNLGPQLKYDGPELIRVASDTGSANLNRNYKVDSEGFDLPAQFEIGASYESLFQENYKFILASSFLSSAYFENEIKIAGEFSYDEIFFLRGGYHFNPESIDEERRIFGPTFGAGIVLKTVFNVAIDYAYRSSERFSANQMFTVKIGF